MEERKKGYYGPCFEDANPANGNLGELKESGDGEVE